MSTEPIRILVADDHPIFRDGLRALIASMPDAELVGEASTGSDVVAAALELQPDVVVMDLHMPEVNGINATVQIVSASPHVAVLVLTMFDDDDSVFAAMRAGARGYMLKGGDRSEIIRAIRAVAEGQAIFAPPIATRVLDYFRVTGENVGELPFPQLTDREREVLELVAQGHSNATIAQRLTLSQKTVRNHASNIFMKLQVSDRAQAIVRARETGLGQGSERSSG